MRRVAMSCLLSCLVACGGSPAASSSPAAPGAPAPGGTLDVGAMPAASVVLDHGDLVVWGSTEVPGSSRMQAAVAMVEAVTRGELAKYIQVRVETLELDVVEADANGERQRVLVASLEAARMAVPAATVIEHGADRVERDGVEVLRLVGRLRVDRDTLARAFAASLAPEDARHADAIVARLFEP